MTTRDPNIPALSETVAALLAAATAPCDRALVALVAHAGLRPIEACGLRVEDVVGGAVRLGASENTAVQRLALLSPDVFAVVRTAAGDRVDGPLLITRSGTPLDPRTAVARVKALARVAEIDGIDGTDAPTLPQLRAYALARPGRTA